MYFRVDVWVQFSPNRCMTQLQPPCLPPWFALHQKAQMALKPVSINNRVDALWSGDNEHYPGVINKELPKKTGESRRYQVTFNDGDEGVVYSPDLVVTEHGGDIQQVISVELNPLKFTCTCTNPVL